MYNPEKDILDWLIAHRGEPIAEQYTSQLAKEIDADTVESCRVCIQFGEEDAELMMEVMEHLNRKFKHEVRRSRKIADNKEHLRKLAEKRGVSNG